MGNLVQEEKHTEFHRDGNPGVLLLVFLSVWRTLVPGSPAPWLPGLPGFRAEYLCLFFLHLLLSGLHLYLSKYIAEQESKHPKSTYCASTHVRFKKQAKLLPSWWWWEGGAGSDWKGFPGDFWWATDFVSFFLWPYHRAGRILVPQPGIETAPPALEVQSLNPWTTREVLILFLDLNANMFPSWKFIKLCA